MTGGVDSGNTPGDILSRVLGSLPVPVAVATYPNLSFVYCNDLALSLMGSVIGRSLTLEELVGRRVPEAAPFFTDLGLVDFVLDVGRQNRPASLWPTEFTMDNGDSRFFSLEAYPLAMGDGVDHLVGVAVEVSTQMKASVERTSALLHAQQAREQAERQAAEIRALLANLTEGVTIRDRHGRVVLRNAMAAQITGVAHEGALDLGVYPEDRFCTGSGDPVPRDQWNHPRLLRGETIVNEEHCIKLSNGELRTVAYNGGVVRDDAGQVVLTVTTFHDVTKLRRMEAAKDQFMQVIAHELRNPLTAATGLIQLSMRDSEVGDRPRVRLTQAMAELKKLGGLVDDVLTGYRVSSGLLPMEIRKTDLLEVARDAVNSFLSVGFEQHRLAASYSNEAPIEVQGDPRRLAQVITNLLSNATKYSPLYTAVELTVEPTADHVTLKVQDRGIGVPTGELEAIFQGFYRATNLADRRSGGVGLGLYISRDIARRHGGDLWAENRPGGGTTMCLRLPRCPVAKENAS